MTEQTPVPGPHEPEPVYLMLWMSEINIRVVTDDNKNNRIEIDLCRGPDEYLRADEPRYVFVLGEEDADDLAWQLEELARLRKRPPTMTNDG